MLTASALANLNTVLNVLMLVGLALGAVLFAPRAWKAAASKAREEEMQRTISVLEDRVQALEPLQEEVKSCRDTATKWEARYHEQAKYTAEGALTAVLKEMTETRRVFETSMESLGELMTEHSRLVARALDRLES